MSINESADEIDGIHKARISKITDAHANRTTRRQLLRQMAGVSLGLPIAQWKSLPGLAQVAADKRQPAPAPVQTALSPEDDQFLDELERKTFLFFWEQVNPQTGLIKDRCN